MTTAQFPADVGVDVDAQLKKAWLLIGRGWGACGSQVKIVKFGIAQSAVKRWGNRQLDALASLFCSSVRYNVDIVNYICAVRLLEQIYNF